MIILIDTKTNTQISLPERVNIKSGVISNDVIEIETYDGQIIEIKSSNDEHTNALEANYFK